MKWVYIAGSKYGAHWSWREDDTPDDEELHGYDFREKAYIFCDSLKAYVSFDAVKDTLGEFPLGTPVEEIQRWCEQAAVMLRMGVA